MGQDSTMLGVRTGLGCEIIFLKYIFIDPSTYVWSGPSSPTFYRNDLMKKSIKFLTIKRGISNISTLSNWNWQKGNILSLSSREELKFKVSSILYPRKPEVVHTVGKHEPSCLETQKTRSIMWCSLQVKIQGSSPCKDKDGNVQIIDWWCHLRG